jgi:hypothetical protein
MLFGQPERNEVDQMIGPVLKRHIIFPEPPGA